MVAQDNFLKDYAPVAPTPASLGKYGDIPVGYHTGVPSISIPVHTLTEGSISVPISLSYHASGIRTQETASWVGLGWALNAGGVITRTVQGAPDEGGNHNQEWGWYKNKGNPNKGGSNCPGLVNIASGYFDSEPDMFSFNINGYSGKFFYDADTIIRIVPMQDLQIQTINIGTQLFSGWIITDPQGNRYHFGATDASMTMTNYVEKSAYSDDPFTATKNSSWYLSKIESADRKDVVQFTYASEKYAFWEVSTAPSDGGIISTSNRGSCSGGSTKAPIIARIDGRRLSAITGSNGSVIFTGDANVRTDLSNFNYCASPVCTLNTEARALKTIEVRDKLNACLRKFELNYTYAISTNPGDPPPGNLPSTNDQTDKSRLVLLSVSEQECSSTTNAKTHSFEYYDQTGLPRRLSYAQDHWGYFNGKTTNTSLAPGALTMKTVCNNCQGNYAYVCTPQTDNREPAFPAMRNGTLKKITYPTGGSSSFEFEAHTTWGTDSICSTQLIDERQLSGGSCISQNSGTYSVTFTQAQINQGILLQISWEPYSSSCPQSGSATLTIYDGDIYSPVKWSGGNGYYNLSNLTWVAGKTYTTKLTPNTAGGISKYKFYNLFRTAVQLNKLVGGLRIKSITTNDGDAVTSNNIVKNYEYADPLIPARSSGKLVHKPIYVALYVQPCSGIGDPDCLDTAHVCNFPTTNEFTGLTCPPIGGSDLHAIFSSSSLQPMQTTMGSHIGYIAVQVKETGNGKSEYRYNMGQYASGPWVPTGYPFPPPPYDPQVGTLASEAHYTESGTLLNAKLYDYLNLSTNVISKTARHANKVSLLPSAITSQFYDISTGYSLLKQSLEQQYNSNGTYVEKKTDIGYSVANGHLQKTTEDVTDSDGTVYRSKYKYAKDYSCTSCNETTATNAEGKAIAAMRKRNMVAIPIEQTSWLKRPSWGSTFKLTSATYFQFDKVNISYDNIKLKAIHQARPASPTTTFTESTTSTSGTFTKDGSYVQEYNFLFSDAHGKILGQWKQNDPAKQQYIWGHNNKLPIAKVINAEDTEVAFTSFEVANEINTGNWTIQNSVSTDWVTTTGNFQTGRTGFKIAATRTITKNNLPPGKYLVSAWYKDGQFTVNNTAIGAVAGSTWLYAETVVTFASTGTINVKGSDAATFIDELRVMPVDALMRTFSYDDRNQLLLSLSDENSVSAHFDYDNFQRLQAVRDQDRNIIQTYEYNYQQAGTALNDIKTTTVLISGQTTVTAVNSLTGANVCRVFRYMDGLGRSIQSNAISQSPTSKDIITINQYDQYGRESKEFLPYTYTTNGGAYRTTALTEQGSFGATYGAGSVAFSESVFEPSPLNRVKELGAPGTTWQTGQGVNAHTIRSSWRGNLATEAVRDFTNGNSYGDNKLWCTETKDENGRSQYTYKDNLGRTVMIKQQLYTTTTGLDDTLYARTYTIYDNFGRVIAIIPPEASRKMNASNNWAYTTSTYSNMIFLYTYDGRGRIISKSVPDAGITSIVYDRLDRPVLTIDANGFKIFTRYDVINRPIVMGRYKGIGSPSGADPLYETPNTSGPHYYTSTTFPIDNNIDIYKVLYYDDYDINNDGITGTDETYTDPSEAGYLSSAFIRIRNKPTATKSAILKNDNSTPTTYLTTRTYYDKNYKCIQINKQNHLTGADISSNAYDFASRRIKTRRDHSATPPGGTLKTYTIREEYIYDHAGRIKFTRHRINKGGWVIISAPIYDELDRMVDKRLHATNYIDTTISLLTSSLNYLQSVDYSYNIRGWLTGINDVTTCTTQSGDNLGDMFKMALTYENPTTGGPPEYNGNISAIEWSTSTNTMSCSNRSLYRLYYDGANRLTTANYLVWTGSWTASNNYTESGISYDLNGNIKSYTRRGLTSGTSTFGVIDKLTYTYEDAARPNRLTKMTDTGTSTKGFKPGSGITGDHYLYDSKGNMTQDKHKGFIIAYNYLNLPISFTKGTNVITMTYSADGEKLTKTITGGATKNYVSGIEYNGANLEAIYHSEGRLTPNGSNFYYEYTLEDHLGNARINFRANGGTVTFLEEMHYYPFGMQMEGIGTVLVTDNQYKYNGKEYNNDFGLALSDYGARWFDAALGRWNTVDPLSESQVDYSSYAYTFNNPLALVDPTGMMPDYVGADNLTNSQWIVSSRIGNQDYRGYYQDKNAKNEQWASIINSNIEKSTGFRPKSNYTDQEPDWRAKWYAEVGIPLFDMAIEHGFSVLGAALVVTHAYKERATTVEGRKLGYATNNWWGLRPLNNKYAQESSCSVSDFACFANIKEGFAAYLHRIDSPSDLKEYKNENFNPSYPEFGNLLRGEMIPSADQINSALRIGGIYVYCHKCPTYGKDMVSIFYNSVIGDLSNALSNRAGVIKNGANVFDVIEYSTAIQRADFYQNAARRLQALKGP